MEQPLHSGRRIYIFFSVALKESSAACVCVSEYTSRVSPRSLLESKSEREEVRGLSLSLAALARAVGFSSRLAMSYYWMQHTPSRPTNNVEINDRLQLQSRCLHTNKLHSRRRRSINDRASPNTKKQSSHQRQRIKIKQNVNMQSRECCEFFWCLPCQQWRSTWVSVSKGVLIHAYRVSRVYPKHWLNSRRATQFSVQSAIIGCRNQLRCSPNDSSHRNVARRPCYRERERTRERERLVSEREPMTRERENKNQHVQKALREPARERRERERSALSQRESRSLLLSTLPPLARARPMAAFLVEWRHPYLHFACDTLQKGETRPREPPNEKPEATQQSWTRSTHKGVCLSLSLILRAGCRDQSPYIKTNPPLASARCYQVVLCFFPLYNTTSLFSLSRGPLCASSLSH